MRECAVGEHREDHADVQHGFGRGERRRRRRCYAADVAVGRRAGRVGGELWWRAHGGHGVRFLSTAGRTGEVGDAKSVQGRRVRDLDVLLVRLHVWRLRRLALGDLLHAAAAAAAAAVAVLPALPAPPDRAYGAAVVQVLVPQPLSRKSTVDKDVVAGDDNLPRCLPCEQTPQEVGQIAQQPLCEEVDAKSRRGLEPVVLVDLRHLREQP